MNRDDCPDRQDAVAEIGDIANETRKLIPSAEISTWDKINWGVAIALAIGGMVAAPFSGGASLIATILGIVWLLIDIVKKVRETANDKKVKEYADRMYERLKFLAWCLEGA